MSRALGRSLDNSIYILNLFSDSGASLHDNHFEPRNSPDYCKSEERVPGLSFEKGVIQPEKRASTANSNAAAFDNRSWSEVDATLSTATEL